MRALNLGNLAGGRRVLFWDLRCRTTSTSTRRVLSLTLLRARRQKIFNRVVGPIRQPFRHLAPMRMQLRQVHCVHPWGIEVLEHVELRHGQDRAESRLAEEVLRMPSVIKLA